MYCSRKRLPHSRAVKAETIRALQVASALGECSAGTREVLGDWYTVHVALCELSVPESAKGSLAIRILSFYFQSALLAIVAIAPPGVAAAPPAHIPRAGRGRSMLACISLVAGQASALVAAPPLRVLCYGDSLTAGTSPPLDTLHPYAPQLEAAIGPSVLVRHRGLPGATAAAMLQWADDEQRGLRSLLRKSSPSLAIILAGTNDLGYHSESAPIVDALRGLHEQCHALDVPSLAVGIPPEP